MDYKYIEQLLERYWACETTAEEEAILKAFFSQEEVPEALRAYQPLFACQAEESKSQPLGDDFDARILALTEEAQPQKAKVVTMWKRLTPLFKAAAIVAVVVTIGNAAQFSTKEKSDEGINYSSYKDTYEDPSMAYDQVEDALKLVSEGMMKAEDADSAAHSANK